MVCLTFWDRATLIIKNSSIFHKTAKPLISLFIISHTHKPYSLYSPKRAWAFWILGDLALHKWKILLQSCFVFRGCSFVSKTKTVESHGAIAVFIADKLQYINGEPLVDMIHDGTTRDVHIPAGFMLGSDGWEIKCTLLLCKWVAVLCQIKTQGVVQSCCKFFEQLQKGLW